MRIVHAALFLAVSASPAFAQHEPVIVVPGKPGVPIFINGVDASWAVVEGEFGLSRPGAVAPTVITRPYLLTAPYPVPGYFPSTGRRPGYGRYEIVPPPDRPLPPPAPTYFRNWSSESSAVPATKYAPYATPNVIVAPRDRRRVSSSSSNHARP
jgi:hypothetical protein